MKENVVLTILSLLTILLLTIHLAGDVALGYEKGGLSMLVVFPIFALWLYGTLVLGGRRSGLIIILVLSLLGFAVPIFHMRGRGMSGAVTRSPNDAFFFIWSNVALGVTTLFSVVLAARRLWALSRRGGPPA